MNSVSFDTLIHSIKKLPYQQKQRIWEMLDEEIIEVEEAEWEKTPEVRQQIRAAKTAYTKQDYATLNQYLAEKGTDYDV